MPRRIALVTGVTLVAASFSIAAYASTGPIMGPTARVIRPAFRGYYDGHQNTYLNTDVSSKTDAAAMHINYSASIGRVKGCRRSTSSKAAPSDPNRARRTTHRCGRRRS